MNARTILLSILLAGVGTCLAGEVSVSDIAYEMTRKDLSQKEWERYAEGAADHYATWINDNPSGSFKRYLDDKLLTRALGVPSGKIENLKKFIYWLALYQHFEEPPPWYIRYLARKHGDKFQSLLQDFSWEKFSNMVRKKAKTIREEEEMARNGKGRAASGNKSLSTPRSASNNSKVKVVVSSPSRR